MHRTWLDPQNCGKMFKNIARCICSLKYDLLPSVLGNLTLSYLSNWEGYPNDKGSSFYQSIDGNTDHGKGKVFSLRLKSKFCGNSEKCDLLSWGGLAHCLHSKHWHFIWSNQDFCPSSQEGLRQKVESTSSTSTFQLFQSHSNRKALRSFLSLGNNITAIYFMIKISEYESFQNLKEDTDLSTVERFPKSRPIYSVGALHPRSWKTLGHISVHTCKKLELRVPWEL